MNVLPCLGAALGDILCHLDSEVQFWVHGCSPLIQTAGFCLVSFSLLIGTCATQ